MKVRTALVLGVLGVLGVAAVAGCSSSTTRSISQTAARNAVAVGMKNEFSNRKHPLKGLPTCRTTTVAGSNTKVNVACTGTTQNGEKATLLGTTSGSNEVHGTFSGAVNGVPLFENDTCIGC